jgi:hypothetical protein
MRDVTHTAVIMKRLGKRVSAETNSRNSRRAVFCAVRAEGNCKRQARPLVRESAPHQQTRNYLTVIKIWS